MTGQSLDAEDDQEGNGEGDHSEDWEEASEN